MFKFFTVLMMLFFITSVRAEVEAGRKSVVEYPVKPLESMPIYSGEILLKEVLSCYPSKTLFKMRVDLVGRANSSDNGISTYSQEYGQSVMGTYVGIEARIPLYSDIELSKERKWEEERRQAVAQNVGVLLKSFSVAQISKRKIAIRKTLEARQAKRVAAGVAFTAEHVQEVEQLFQSELDYHTAMADIENSRTALIGLCMEGKEDGVKNLVDSIINDIVKSN